MFPSLGQSSGDFKETSGRVQPHHIVVRNTVGFLTADALTQANPPVVTTSANVSTVVPTAKRGVLGGSVMFTRPDAGNGQQGGPVAPGGTYNARIKPLGLALNDVLGNAFENTPGVASNRGPYLAAGGTASVAIYETQRQIGGSTALTYQTGDRLYASVNGYLTNRLEDAYEYNVSGQNSIEFVTLMGIVKQAPDSSNPLLTLDLRVLSELSHGKRIYIDDE